MATAVVSLPPRPSVVTSFLCETPWYPAMTTILPRASSSWTRNGRTSMMGVDVSIVGDDAGLAASEADRVAAALANRHRQQRHRDALAGEQHVQLAPVGVGGDLLGQRQQVVGRISHGGNHDHDIVAELPRPHDPLCDLPQPFNVRHTAAAVLSEPRQSSGKNSQVQKVAHIIRSLRLVRRPMTVRRIVLSLAILAALVIPSSAQQTPLRSPDVIFVPTPQEVVDAMLKLAKVTKNDVVYDLGSGDGRIPITAAKTYGARRRDRHRPAAHQGGDREPEDVGDGRS